jgi:hypothetical protein
VALSLPGGSVPTEISAGIDHSVAMIAGGEAYGWGYNDYGQLGNGGTTERDTPTPVGGYTSQTQLVASPGASRLGRPVRRYAHRLAEDRAWLHEDLAVDGLIGARVKGGPLSSFDQALQEAVGERAAMADPEERERRMVHPQFYATVYQRLHISLNGK